MYRDTAVFWKTDLFMGKIRKDYANMKMHISVKNYGYHFHTF